MSTLTKSSLVSFGSHLSLLADPLWSCASVIFSVYQAISVISTLHINIPFRLWRWVLLKPGAHSAGLGVSNLAGAAFCAYPSTGSFARSAVQSTSGAKTGIAVPSWDGKARVDSHNGIASCITYLKSHQIPCDQARLQAKACRPQAV